MQLGAGPWPPIGAVDTLALPGPHGSVTVRRHTPSSPPSSPSGALVYIHGGGFTYGTLDEFEVPMRLIAERAGIVTYIVEYQLAPEAKYPVQIEEIEYIHNPNLTHGFRSSPAPQPPATRPPSN
jgi:acetyl esterase/lipase